MGKGALGGLVVIALLLGGLWWWQRAPATTPVTLTIGTGPSGGVYDAFGRGLAQASAGSGTPVEVRSTAASVANIRMVQSGEVDGGFTLADVAALAVRGDAPFDEPQLIRAIARLYDNHTHLVVRSESRYWDVTDLAGQPVSLGAAGSGTEMIAERLLDEAEVLDGPAAVQTTRMDLVASAEALEAGEIEAFFWSGGLPTEAITTLTDRTMIRLIDLAEYVPRLAERYGHYFAELPVPAGTYPGVPAVRTVGVPSLLVVHRDMPEEVAWSLTRTLMESRDALAEIHPVAYQLSARSAISTLPVQLHPGAIRYYQEIKVAHDVTDVAAAPPPRFLAARLAAARGRRPAAP